MIRFGSMGGAVGSSCLKTYGAGSMLGARYERLREEVLQYRASLVPQLG
jgi:hypothetical protein